MRKNPERLAWLVLIISFTLCSLTATVVPVTAKRLIDEHTSVRPARLDIIYGTVLVKQVGTPSEQSAKDSMNIEPGDVVRTAGDSRAILWLFDQSNVELGPDSTVSLSTSYSSTFSDQVSALALDLASGRPAVNVALPGTRERQFTVRTSLGSLALDEGSYELDLSQPHAGEAVVRAGRALVTTAGATVTCRTWERVEMRADKPPTGPLSLARNLVRDAGFRQPRTDEAPLGADWKGDERNSERNIGTVSAVDDPDGNYLSFWREGTGHGENYAVQNLGKDVSQYRTLKLSVDMRIVAQSLGGGGVAGSEYPVHLRLRYRNALGREATYETAFYYQNPQNHPTTIGQQVEHNQWVTFEKDLLTLDSRPAYIYYLEVAASGWDYESHIRNPRIMAE